MTKGRPAMETVRAVHSVYVIESPDARRYVGCTSKPIDARWREHMSSARCGYAYPLHQAMRRHGAEPFTVSVVAQSSGLFDGRATEKAVIAQLLAAGCELFNAERLTPTGKLLQVKPRGEHCACHPNRRALELAQPHAVIPKKIGRRGPAAAIKQHGPAITPHPVARAQVRS